METQTMKAIRIDKYGDENVLQTVQIPIPVPKKNEVLISVKTAGINPLDWKIRDGAGIRFGMTLPIYLGSEIAGIVEKTGNSVKRLKPGDEVFGMIKSGGYAEYTIAEEHEVVLKPQSASFESAGGLALAALTAWQAMFDLANLQTGQKIFITASSGGVGSIAVQLAKAKGAFVVGMSSGKNEEYVRALGADEFIDYNKNIFEDLVKDMEVVFDTVGGDTFLRAHKCVKKGGFIVTSVAFPVLETAEEYSIRSARVHCVANADQLAEISGLIESGLLKTQTSTVLPFAEVRKAHQLSKTGHTRGKIILQIGA